MRVNVDLHEMHRIDGTMRYVLSRVTIEHSPREGLDNAILKDLEVRLTKELQEGLDAALDAGLEPAKGGE